ILSIGFSGADLGRAAVIAFVTAMLLSKRRTIWFAGLVALLIDRVFWPAAEQAIAGADFRIVATSIAAIGATFLDDLGLYMVRYLGIVAMISVFVAVRWRIHKPFVIKEKKT
ncbi:MAG: hypothetical protein AAF850_03345, partial [Pseudomonadota bacterium]